MRELRRHMRVSQGGLAELMGTRQQTISEWERGVYLPRGASRALLARVAEESGFRYDAGGGDAPARFTPGPSAPSERELCAMWEAASPGAACRAGGERWRLLFPGRRNRGPGPDFRDALVVDPRGRVLTGDVELHRNAREWRSHGHGRDPRYNGVLLHVVLRAREGTPTRLELGLEVPTVPLDAVGGAPAGGAGAWSPPCRETAAREGERAVVDALRRAGEERLAEKGGRFALRLGHAGPDEVLYRGILEALGYSANREPFHRLALALPFAQVRAGALAQPGHMRGSWLVDFMLAASGLGTDGEQQRAGLLPLVDPREWRCSGVRPCNHPRLRLRAAAELLHRFLPTGPARALEPLVAEGEPAGLVEALTVPGRGSGPALLGRSRALDIAVNVVLPFFHALAQGEEREYIPSGVRRMYGALPRLQENEVTREFRRRVFERGHEAVPLRAAAQQGMVHLHRHGCRWLACRYCPLGRPPADTNAAERPRQEGATRFRPARVPAQRR